MRRPLKKGIKGPVFPSFYNQQTPRPHKQYLSHTKLRQAMRNLRQACVHILKLKDDASVAARERCRQAVNAEPKPEYAYLHLLNAAREACDATGESFPTAMNYLLDKFAEQLAELNQVGVTQTLVHPQESHGQEPSGVDARCDSQDGQQDQLDASEGKEGRILSAASA
jgi:hypothetical protein